MHQLKYYLFLTFPLLFIVNSYSQKSTQLYTSYDAIVEKENLPVYNGIFYRDPLYKPKDDSHPFFQKNDFTNGGIFYINQWYNDLQVKYDLLNQVLVLSPPSSIKNVGIEMIQDKIKSFYIGDDTFLNLSKLSPIALKKGYYKEDSISEEVKLYSFISKRSKEFYVSKDIQLKFYISYQFIVLHKEIYHVFNNENDLLKIFPNKEKEILEYYKNRSSNNSENVLEFNLALLKKINF